MAKKSELVNPTIAIPSGTYLVFIESVTLKFTKPKKGKPGNHPMAEYDLQVIAPEQVETEQGPVNPCGRRLKWWQAFTPRNLIPVQQTELLLGITLPEEYDEVEDCIKPLQGNKGRCFEAKLVSEPFYKTDNGKWDGTVVKDDSGQPIIAGYRLQFGEPLSAIGDVPPGVEVAPVADAGQSSRPAIDDSAQ